MGEPEQGIRRQRNIAAYLIDPVGRRNFTRSARFHARTRDALIEVRVRYVAPPLKQAILRGDTIKIRRQVDGQTYVVAQCLRDGISKQRWRVLRGSPPSNNASINVNDPAFGDAVVERIR